MIETIFCSLFLIISVATQTLDLNCNSPPLLRSGNTLSKLETGLDRLYLPQGDKTRSHTFEVQFQKEYDKTPQVSLTIVYIHQYRPVSGLDFSVRASPTQSMFTAHVFIAIESRWSFIDTQYISTGRDNFYTGTFIPDESTYMNIGKSSEQEDVMLVEPLSQDYKITGSDVIHRNAFLSGIKCENSAFSLKINEVFYDKQDLTISVNVSLSNVVMPVEKLQITFMIFSVLSRVDLRALANPHEHIHNQISQTDSSSPFLHAFFMSGINKQAIQSLALSGSRRFLIGDLSLTHVRQFKQSFYIQGFQFQATNTLMLSPKNAPSSPSSELQSPQCLSGEECLKKGGKILNETFCQFCAENQEYDQIKNQCHCKQGYYRLDNQCKTLDRYCRLTLPTNQVECDDNQILDPETNSCKCDQGYQRVQFSNKTAACLRKCPNLQSFRNDQTYQCQCYLSSKYLDEEQWQCISCPPGQKWDFLTKQCKCWPPLRERFDKSCIYCARGTSYYDQQQKDCVCKQGYEKVGQRCIKPKQSL